MFCFKCGSKNPDESKFCYKCGAKLEQTTVTKQVNTQKGTNPKPEANTSNPTQASTNTRSETPSTASTFEMSEPYRTPVGNNNPPPQKKDNSKKTKMVVLICAACFALFLVIGTISAVALLKTGFIGSHHHTKDDTDVVQSDNPSVQTIDGTTINYMSRPSILKTTAVPTVTPCVDSYSIAGDLSNVYNHQLVDNASNEYKQQLINNGFVISNGYGLESFEVYESNRYDYTANFVTVDSMMHTYHLYFSYLLKNTERNYLTDDLKALSSVMMNSSSQQYNKLKGSEWEQSAYNNMVFFAVANALIDPSYSLPDDVKDMASKEIELVNAAEGITTSPLMDDFEDYSQYKPRGYYENDENLSRYFRTMMWYGRRNFKQNSDADNRSAFLITMALKDGGLKEWEAIYTVTSFFAGASDDSGYYEYMPVIEAAYGTDVSIDSIIGDDKSWKKFNSLTSQLAPPKINSVPVVDTDDEEEKQSHIIGYRFMGQRFSIDESIFQQLIYSNVKEDSKGNKRMLPDALDVPAALGSDTALDILTQQGDTDYKNYSKHMDKLRTEISASDASTWNASLYSGWINTLRPLLDDKGEGYPLFMQNENWKKKDLITFCGSYAELKHDTILYSKQVIAEMGGGDIPVLDDRGYVEPEVLVYARLTDLVNSTRDGLESYGYLDSTSKEDLNKLSELSSQLQTISEKELRNELPTDEEFELIRTYGGQLEHFWQESNRDQQVDYLSTQEFPGAIIADVATDPNGSCLEVGTGYFNRITVIVPVDGQLKIATGTIYSFYEFSQPISDRLTDTQWREMLGIFRNPENPTNGEDVELPAWEKNVIYEW